ncbi:SSI family serine proteinase inhibitor [Streptomonospora algeriensis]|uniref:SSI family serine proteinase inhibitor n=1 Tax=Streptomonospora algeriensis TaxID=995084 RepID=A0ABW3BFY7_9ACTN
MRKRRTPVLLALLAGLTALAPAAHAEEAVGASSAESAAQAAQIPDSVLRLSVTVPEERAVDRTTLHCRPPGGSHPRAEAACAALDSAGGDFRTLGERSRQTTMCTMQYAPVRLRASGLWHGASVDYTETFSNACVAHAETGGVFDFQPR